MSPSGKAAGSGPAIRGFESLHPSQDEMFIVNTLSWLFKLYRKRQDKKSAVLWRRCTLFVVPTEAIFV